MFVTRQEWIAHKTDKGTRVPIYSLHVHPLGTKLATAGQDGKIKIWCLATCKLRTDAFKEDTSTLLSTLTNHQGSVMCVRWSNHNGLYLASGSDDCMRGTRGVRSHGNLEGPRYAETWRPKKVLAGHGSDIADLAWSPDNEYIASCACDSTVMIWSGETFERLRILSGFHSGFVKGVTWDPVGRFFATQSDDKTTRIWRISDWAVEAVITEPYEQAASTTFFRRLSWSPDGGTIVTANGENGSVPTAPIIDRNGFTSEVSLIGHKAPVECALFNPIIFEMPDSTKNGKSAICAVGSQDNCVSIWWTAKANAITRIHHAFEHSVLDLAWSPDGLMLFACSYDGTVTVIEFDCDEFGTPVPASEVERTLSNYGSRRKALVSESTLQLDMEERNAVEAKKLASARIQSLMGGGGRSTSTNESPARLTNGAGTPRRPSPSIPSRDGLASPSPVPPAALKQTVTRTSDGKKRIQPTFLSVSPVPGPTLPRPATSVGTVTEEITEDEAQPGEFASSTGTDGLPGGGILSVAGVKRKAADDDDRDKSGKVPRNQRNVGSRALNGSTQAVRVSNNIHSKTPLQASQYVLPTIMEVHNPVNLAIPEVQSKKPCCWGKQTRLASSLVLRTPKEYHHWLIRYARKLADESAVTKIKELCDSLLGPLASANQSSPLSADGGWDPLVLGLRKRELLKEILPIIAGNRGLQRTVQQYDETLKGISAGESLSMLGL
ncbi:HIR complex subunit [Borealophlyctis nickersoniae]|nr:HIR complex subunit [Borealophlyctis nickersoniae]